jgi:hypothetical protein
VPKMHFSRHGFKPLRYGFSVYGGEETRCCLEQLLLRTMRKAYLRG